MQKHGVPTSSIVTEQFVSLAKTAATGLGYPDLPMTIVPHPFETLPADRVKQLAEEKADAIVAQLMRPQEAVIRA